MKGEAGKGRLQLWVKLVVYWPHQQAAYANKIAKQTLLVSRIEKKSEHVSDILAQSSRYHSHRSAKTSSKFGQPRSQQLGVILVLIIYLLMFYKGNIDWWIFSVSSIRCLCLVYLADQSPERTWSEVFPYLPLPYIAHAREQSFQEHEHCHISL